jgi:Ser/Thr protein kinase RdoA (MazF antagonist)
LYRHVAGDEYDFARPEHAVAAGAMLARFHRAAAGFDADAPPPEHKPSIGACWADADRDVAEFERALVGEGVEGDLRELRGWWRDAHDALPVPAFEALPSGFMHGDWHGRNLVYRGDEIVALLDFDDVDHGPYVYDIAAGMLKFGRAARGNVELRLRPEVARRFLEGYASVRAPSDAELAALPVLAAMLYPPNPRHYSWWRAVHGRDPAQLLREDIAVMRTVRAEMARTGGLF